MEIIPQKQFPPNETYFMIISTGFYDIFTVNISKYDIIMPIKTKSGKWKWGNVERDSKKVNEEDEKSLLKYLETVEMKSQEKDIFNFTTTKNGYDCKSQK